MKAFEEWWDGNMDRHINNLIKEGVISDTNKSKEIVIDRCKPYKQFYRQAWKAALEWALSTESYVGSVAENIEEELEDV